MSEIQLGGMISSSDSYESSDSSVYSSESPDMSAVRGIGGVGVRGAERVTQSTVFCVQDNTDSVQNDKKNLRKIRYLSILILCIPELKGFSTPEQNSASSQLSGRLRSQLDIKYFSNHPVIKGGMDRAAQTGSRSYLSSRRGVSRSVLQDGQSIQWASSNF